jgi:hypothetical protein
MGRPSADSQACSYFMQATMREGVCAAFNPSGAIPDYCVKDSSGSVTDSRVTLSFQISLSRDNRLI